ncbi:MAG: hypothetical protein JW864_13950 [Spirochaetes bacterium]|nr:hypothetical protein [Spirochaetota bacterium]
MKKLLLFLFFAAIISFIACGEEEKYKVTLVVEKDEVTTDCTVYAKACLGANQGIDCEAEYSTSAAFTNGSATIVIEDVEEDTYTAGLFIDVNGNGAETLTPDCPDDYAIAIESITVDDDINETIESDDDGWGGPGGFDWCK